MKHNTSTKACFIAIIAVLSLMLSAWNWADTSWHPVSIAATPIDGSWTGTTSRGYPMSFTVLSTGTQWNDFKLKTDYNFGFCYGTTEVTVSKPGNFPTSQFSYTSSTYSFAGQFTSPTTASGTYSFVNDYITGCGYLTQSGTWTASVPLPPPGAFSKTAPANGTTELSVNPSLSWGSSTNANSYEYCYDTTNNASCDTAWNSVGTATSTVLSGLIERTKYYWQLRAIGSSGTHLRRRRDMVEFHNRAFCRCAR